MPTRLCGCKRYPRGDFPNDEVRSRATRHRLRTLLRAGSTGESAWRHEAPASSTTCNRAPGARRRFCSAANVHRPHLRQTVALFSCDATLASEHAFRDGRRWLIGFRGDVLFQCSALRSGFARLKSRHDDNRRHSIRHRRRPALRHRTAGFHYTAPTAPHVISSTNDVMIDRRLRRRHRHLRGPSRLFV